MQKHLLLSLLLLSCLFYSNTNAQCVTPVGSDTSLCNPAAVDLNVSGNTGFYNWYNSASGPSFLDTGITFQTPLVSLRDTFYVSEYDTGATTNALLFDGNNDRAPIQDFIYNTTGIPEATIEVWINTTNPNNQIIASYDRSEYWRLEINGNGAGPGQIGFDISTNAGVLDFGSVSRIDDGLWHHVAAVFDNGTVSIYIDGVLDATTSLGTTFGTGLTRFGFLGVGSEANVFDGTTGPNDNFDGEMGNFRIWSVARTQAEIQQNMDRCLNGAQANLEVVYKMNGSGTDDVIIDYSGNQYNAEFRNFPGTGAWVSTGPSLNTCFQCESARDTVIVDIIPVPANFLGGDTCIAGDSVVLDAGSDLQNFLWQDASTQQTFIARNSGFYSVTVEDTSGCPGGDTVRVFINPKPTGIDTNFCGSGDYQLRATGSNGLYKWYSDFNATAPVDTGKLDFTLTQTDTFYVAGYDTLSKSDALTFDASASNYASVLNYSYLGGNYTELTIQTWIRTTNGATQIIASFDRSEYWRLEIDGNGGSFGTIGLGINTDAGILDFGGSIRVDDGNWHHIAAVFDNGDVSIYVDGVLDNNTNQGSRFGAGVTRFGFLGTGSEADTEDGTTGPNAYFDGSIADFSVYERALSQSEIQAALNNCKVGGESGLAFYYPFTEGEGTVLSDRSGNARNAVLKNTFAGDAWIEDGPQLEGCASECESERDTVIAILEIIPNPQLGPDICASVPTVIDAGANYTSYLWNTTATTQTITTDENNEGQFFVVVDSAGTPCIGTDSIVSNIILVPEAQDSSRCGPGVVELGVSGGSNFRWFDKNGAVQVTSSTFSPTLTSTDTFLVSAIECGDTITEGLVFDGTDDYIALDMFYNTAGQLPELSVEAWVRTNFNTAGANDNWAIVDFDRSEYYNFYVLGDGRVGFSTEPSSGGPIDDFYSDPAVRVNDGVWHHIAGVYDGTNKYIYIDGVLISTQTNPHGGLALGNGSTRYGFIGDGSEAGSFNAGRNNIHYEGEIAEVRIWNTTRSGEQISANRDICLDGSEPGLAAYYKTDDGTGSTTLTDYSGNNRNGTLFNMDPATAWINTNNDIFCGCCISDGDTAVATIYNLIDSTRTSVSCPSIDSSSVLITPFGGSGQFDYRELSGEFVYSTNFSAGESRRSLENGGIYQMEVTDTNGCLDTTANIVINTTPTVIASSTSSGSCRIIDQNKFAFIVNASNEVILGISSPADDLGSVDATVYVQPNAMVFNGDAYLGRHFTVDSDSTISTTANVRFPLFTAELTDLIDTANATPSFNDDLVSIAELGVTRYNGPTEDGTYDPSDATNLLYIDQAGNGSQFGVNYFDVSTNGFSEFWPHSSFASTPLPILLRSFDLELNQNNDVVISWSTFSEVNNDYFTIEKSVDGKIWGEVGKVSGSGNSTELKQYQLVDENPYFGRSYYRLKQTDFDGRFEYFDPKAIELNPRANELSIYPNPTNGMITIDLSGKEFSGSINLRIHSTEGKLIYQSNAQIPNSDSNERLTFDLSEQLSDGIYIVSLSTSKEVYTTKLIVNR